MASIVVGELIAMFRDELHIDVPSPETDLFEAGLIDSLQLVLVLTQLEQRLGVRISLDEIDLEDLRSVGRLARIVERRSDAQPALPPQS